jgi:FixJ family two-component response regulator
MVDKKANLIRIIDDDESIRESFCYLLSGEGWRTAAYASAEEFLENDDVSEPGCLVVDVKMPGGMTGLELQQELLRCSCGLPLIFVSAHGSIEMAVRAVQSGACDFIPKPVDEEKLLTAIEKAVEKRERLYRRESSLRALEEKWNSLTAREKEIARCLARGMPNKVIAAQFKSALRTVQVHRASIYLKLGVRSAAEITRLLDAMNTGENG